MVKQIQILYWVLVVIFCGGIMNNSYGQCTNDIDPPVVSNCPGDITINSAAGSCSQSVTWTEPSAVDNCSDTVYVTANYLPGSTFPLGTTLVTYTFTDTSGNSAVCTFNIIVNDSEPPVIAGCPADISVVNTPGSCGAFVTWTPPVATDNCSGLSFVSTDNPGDFFDLGVTTVTYIATDTAGNATTCSFNITVTDSEAPTFFNCPANITVNTANNACTRSVSWIPPSVSENCGTLTITASHTPGHTFSLGTTTVTYTATDGVGNTAVCSFDVTVVDNQFPVINNCPSNRTVTAVAGTCASAAVSWTAPTASDNCSGVTLTSNYAPGSTFPVGTTQVIYTSTDGSGNITTCSFNVVVTDTEAPVISGCPANISVNNDYNACGAIVNWTAPTVTDNCSATITASHNPGDFFPAGVTTVTYTATDASGNVSTCTFTVTVADSENPVITCPANIVVNADPNACTAVTTIPVPVTSDNCGVATVVNDVTGTADASGIYSIGVTTVTYTVTDNSGNTATCSFTVTVNDLENPTITCPANIVADAAAGTCSAAVTVPAPVAADNCGIASIVNDYNGTADASGTYPVGVTAVIYTVTDLSGNTATCSFSVTVNDIENPTIACPTDISVNTDGGACTATVSVLAPVTADNCGVASVVNNFTGTADASGVYPLGVTTVVYTVTDNAGNTATCSFTVTVTDIENPTITCPVDISTSVDMGTCSATVTVPAPATADNCGVASVVNDFNGTANASGVYPVGTTTVVYTVTDYSGNSATCSFTVTVLENEAPVISCPANITATAEPGICGATVAVALPTVTDNCGVASFSNDFNNTTDASGFYPVGVTTVTYTVTDLAGNTATCSFTVTVNDIENPTIACPADISVDTDGGACTATVSVPSPVTADNCGVASVVNNFNGTADASGIYPLGVTTVIYTVTDVNGNTATCSFTVMVTDIENPGIACPANISTTTDVGSCNATVTIPAPVVTDNCSIASITNDFNGTANASGVYPAGVTTVIYTVTDLSGNTATCSFTVTVTENEAPAITCPADIIVSSDAAACGASVTIPVPTATDNCGVASVVNDFNNTTDASGYYPVGISTVVYTVTDVSGNTATCSFTVTVNDIENPIIACPANISVNTDGGACTATVSVPSPVTADNCGVASVVNSFTGTADASGVYPLGVTTVVYTVTDINGNTATCAIDVVVTDIENPSVTCPANITTTVDAGTCSATITVPAPAATDNCGVASVVNNFTGTADASGVYPVGATTVVYTVTDNSGNTATCSFTVTVTETELPVISCPANIIVNTDNNACDATVTIPAPLATDNCGVASIVNDFTGTANASGIYPIGITTVTYTVTDISGNTTTCNFTVTVEDNEAPVFASCPANISVSADAGACDAVVSWTAPVASDNCTGVTVVASHNPGDVFTIGMTTVTYTATDAANNVTVCSFTVTVADTEAPVIAGCPADITVNATGCDATVTWSMPTATDNCAGVTVVASHTSGDVFPVGTTAVTYTATDAAGNTTVCTFNVIVLDAEAPVFAGCPSAITANAAAGSCNAVVSWTAPTATDNCSGIAVVASHNSGDIFPVGTTTVTYTATDASGNTAVCSFDVTIFDMDAPTVVSCTADISTAADAGNCGAIVTWTSPVFDDNCGYTVSSTHTPGTFFNIGTTTVTYTAIDASGNSVDCSFNVTVTDNEAPAFAGCPINITIGTDAGACDAVVNWTAPIASDNCAGVTVVASHISGDVFPIGTTTVTYTATDASSNIAVCSFTITVTDTELPVIAGCPANITVAAVGCDAIVTWTAPTATDNCAGVTMVASHTSGDVFPVGTTTVNYTATDAAGNTAVCSFTVTVTETEAPVIAGCPSDISVNADAGSCNAIVNWTAPTATDNCGVTGFISTHNSGDAFVIGTTTVVYTATDANGNSATCSFTVTVTDTEAPVISGCPADINIDADAGTCGAIVTWTAPTVADNCAGVTMTASHNPGDLFPIGTTTVTYTATDAAGLTATCSFVITITDNEAPVFAGCASNIIVSADAGACNAVVNWTAPIATDNCAGVTMTASHNPGDVFPIGTTTVTYTATDANNNTSVCSFTITVEDTEAPVFAGCPSDMSVSADAGTCGAIVNWTAPTATDNCAGVTVVASHNPGDVFPIGTTTVTYTATDANNNTVVCSLNITVADNEAPVFAGCPSDIIICGETATWTAPVASDNCSGVTVVASHNSGDIFPVGTTTVTYTTTDASGNSAVCSFTVTRSNVSADAGADAAICAGNTVVIGGTNTANGTVTPFTISWSPATGLDNASIANPTASPATTTIYTVTVTDANGCSGTDEVTVTVNPLPIVNVTSAGPLCESSAAITLSATPANGTFTGTGVTGNIFNPATAGVGTHIITYTVTDANGCTNSATTSIVVNADPVVTITPVAPVCIDNGIITLTAATTGGIWSGNGIVNATTGKFNPAIAGAGMHLISYKVTNAAGCTATGTTTIEVVALPEATISTTGPLCTNSAAVTLTTATAGGTFSGNGVDPVTGIFDPATAGAGQHIISYTVTAAGCTNSATTTVVVYEAPIFTINPVAPVCASSDVITLTATKEGGVWSGNGIVNNYAGAFNPAKAGAGIHTISYTVTNIHGCSTTETTTVTVTPAPDATITPVAPMCANSAPIALTAATAGGTFSGKGVSGNQFDPSVADVGFHIVTYTVTGGGCTSEATSTIRVAPSITASAAVNPTSGPAQTDGSIDITAKGGSGNYTYSWSTGASTEDVSGLAAGTYTVTVNDQIGCATVFTYTVIDGRTTGIAGKNLEPVVKLYPNPTSGTVIIDIQTGASNEVELMIFDILGKKIDQVNTRINGKYSHSFHLEGQAAGQYYMVINVEGKVITRKFSVIK